MKANRLGKERVNSFIVCWLGMREKKTRTHKDLLFSVLEAHVTIFENKYWLKVEMCEILNLSLDVSNSTSDITNPRHLVRIHKESECVCGAAEVGHYHSSCV